MNGADQSDTTAITLARAIFAAYECRANLGRLSVAARFNSRAASSATELFRILDAR